MGTNGTALLDRLVGLKIASRASPECSVLLCSPFRCKIVKVICHT
jgi:hypothetical protein